MNRAFYIAGIALSFIFLFVCGHYESEMSRARLDELMSFTVDNMYDTYSSTTYIDYSGITQEAGFVSLLFILFFIAMDILGILKVKTQTMKVMGIIGLSLSGIYFFWDLAVLSSPESMSWGEVGGGFAFYGMVMLAFSIVGLVQSIRYHLAKTGPVNRTIIDHRVNKDTADFLD